MLITYQSFRAREAQDLAIHPYLLKEYRNRWFLLGLKHGTPALLNLALDRIHALALHEGVVFVPNTTIDSTYFDDIIGVTKNNGVRVRTVRFWVSSEHAPYVKTKPLHRSQRLESEDVSGSFFTIRVVPNYELEREILGFGEAMRVLAPAYLVGKIRERLRGAFGQYGG